jgi:D-tyrosyl-tRNA(Tyr) deacylase
MRAIIQRVLQGSVTLAESKEVVGQINKGLLVLIGIQRDDTPADVDFVCRKILNIRLWDDAKGRSWSSSVIDNDYEVLLGKLLLSLPKISTINLTNLNLYPVVSQFTLYGIMKGNKPDFHQAMNGEFSRPMFDGLVEKVKQLYKPDKVQSMQLIFQILFLVKSMNTFVGTDETNFLPNLITCIHLCLDCSWCFWSDDACKVRITLIDYFLM